MLYHVEDILACPNGILAVDYPIEKVPCYLSDERKLLGLKFHLLKYFACKY